MRKIWNELINEAAPTLIGLFVVITLVALSAGACFWSIKWFLTMLGVI
jgi:hypothetical protein